MLTKEQVTKYIDNGWNQCPYCGSNDLFAGSYSCDGNTAYCEVHCETCDKRWRDLHTLTEIEEIID